MRPTKESILKWVILFALICVSACDKTKKKPALPDLEFRSITWTSSNPSILNSPESSARISTDDFASEQAYDSEMKKLLDDTEVNGALTLREFIAAHTNRDIAALNKIEEARDKGPKKTGAGYATLSFDLGGSGVVRANLQETKMTGYWPTFWEQHIKDKVSETTAVPTATERQKPVVEKRAKAIDEDGKERLKQALRSGELALPSGQKNAYVKEGDQTKEVGVLQFDKRGAITIVSETGSHDDWLKRTVKTINDRDTINVIVAPPKGKRGKYGQAVARDSEFLGAALRQHLAHVGLYLRD